MRRLTLARFNNTVLTKTLLTVAIAILLIPATATAGPDTVKPAETALPVDTVESTLDLPWREAGLDERQAAAHLLDRLAYGPRPGEVDRVVAMGLETWVERQLRADLDDRALEERFETLKSHGLTARQASETYPSPGMVLRLAGRSGQIDPEDLQKARAERESGGDRSSRDAMRTQRELRQWAQDQGYRPIRELLGEMMAQKLFRALHSPNQLQEVLVDFWFNHFNVSLTDNEARVYVPSYERDAIRPHVLGGFRDMVEATAKHPAMLLYLDNSRSVANPGVKTTFDRESLQARQRGRRGALGDRARRGGFGDRRGSDQSRADRMADMDPDLRQQLEDRRPQGLNENYARELLELHTLGVDGGYTQDDVIEVARAFTGWATYPPGPAREDVERRIARARRLPGSGGFVFEDSFIFRADVHDAEKKKVLGQTLPAGRGMEDGLQVLDMLAVHPSTAQHLARKLAIRFVGDTPSDPLVDTLASTYLRAGGQLEPVMRALVQSPEFWAPDTLRAKIKTPFELTVSALRTTGAKVDDPRGVLEWVRRLGQPLYAYQAPTGFPDTAEAWVNTGALLNRMNFGLQLATGRIGGVSLDLPALHDHREPESVEAALETYVPLILPGRDAGETLRQLGPVVRDPELGTKIADAAGDADDGSEWSFMDDPGGDTPFGRRSDRRPPPLTDPDDSPLAHVVGVILGSPEFQRR